jgi:hypothetical protein
LGIEKRETKSKSEVIFSHQPKLDKEIQEKEQPDSNIKEGQMEAKG